MTQTSPSSYEHHFFQPDFAIKTKEVAPETLTAPPQQTQYENGQLDFEVILTIRSTEPVVDAKF